MFFELLLLPAFIHHFPTRSPSSSSALTAHQFPRSPHYSSRMCEHAKPTRDHERRAVRKYSLIPHYTTLHVAISTALVNSSSVMTTGQVAILERDKVAGVGLGRYSILCIHRYSIPVHFSPSRERKDALAVHAHRTRLAIEGESH